MRLHLTETQLVQGCRAKDRLAQKALYDRYKTAMYTLAYRITNDFGQAEEVLQDAFLKVFKHITSFKGTASLGSWIKTIVIRTALKKIQRKIIFEPLEDHLLPTLIDWGHTLESDYLEQAIQSLPEGFRAVFVLIEIEGYTHKEVANLLDIATGTSKSQLFHAKKKLKNILKNQ